MTTATIDVISFKCTCGKRLRARSDQAGRTYACPGCGANVDVPSFQVVPVVDGARVPSHIAPAAPSSDARTFAPFARIPATVPELLTVLLAAWGVAAISSLFLMLFGWWGLLLAIVIMIFMTMATAQQVWLLVRARQLVLQQKQVPLMWGTVELLAWEPTEGVLILKNKAVSFADDDLHDGVGGVRFIYPLLGEELALRVPLETQTLHFADHNVLTKEYLHLSVRGTMKWRIVDIRKFYLLVSRELRSTTEPTAGSQSAGAFEAMPRTGDAARQATARLINATIEWLRALAEEQTRIVVSRVRSGLLIADRLAAELPEVRIAADGNVGDATHGLAGNIHEVVASSLERYGIAVDDVSLQEVKLPAEIVAQCVEACRTAYLPLIATRQASQRKAELQAEADVLGKEVVGARELISHAPAYALRDFLSEFVARKTGGALDAKSAAANAAAASVIASTLSEPQAALPDAKGV